MKLSEFLSQLGLVRLGTGPVQFELPQDKASLLNEDVVVKLENVYDADHDDDTFIPVAELKLGNDAELGGVELILEATVVPSVSYLPKSEYIAGYDDGSTPQTE